uniref:CDGSH iron-sulfur domain-containing protein 2 n=1 Tax=Equus caballus TaxID=9796 RepID=A0A9L0RYQ6_HORSE
TSLARSQSAPGRSPLFPGPDPGPARARAQARSRPAASTLGAGAGAAGLGEQRPPREDGAGERGPHRQVSEWLRLLPFLGVLALLGYLAVRPFLPKKKQQKDSLINLKIQKENPKVVNEINIEDLCLTKAAYCRCWRSKTFPACDGSHNKHNELTGDNVGPLILKKKEV